MKKIIALLTACLMLSATTLFAQKLVGGYSLGYGSFQMNDMKYILENDLKNYQNNYPGIKYKTVDNFPSGLVHNAYLGVRFSTNEAGIRYDFFTTGGRNQVADYSGELRNDVYIKGNAFGLYYKTQFLSLPMSNSLRLSCQLGVATGLIYNEGRYHSIRKFNKPVTDAFGYATEDLDEEDNFTSTNWYAEPNITVQFWFKDIISLNLNASYMFDKQGKVIIFASETDYGVNWSGIRASIGIGFAIPYLNK